MSIFVSRREKTIPGELVFEVESLVDADLRSLVLNEFVKFIIS